MLRRSAMSKLVLMGLVLLLVSLGRWAYAKQAEPIVAPPYQFEAMWSQIGGDYPKFDQPADVAIDHRRDIYVADPILRAVFKFDGTGKLLDVWKETPDQRFARPSRIAIDVNTVYIVDRYVARIFRFDLDGKPLQTWNLKGTGEGKISEALGICIDPLGQVYILDHNNDRILSYSSNGEYIKSFGEKGEKPGKIFGPTDIACDADGNILVIDFNDRVQRFTPDGTLMQSIGKKGSKPGEFNDPTGLALGIDGAIYIADTVNGRIQKIIVPSVDDSSAEKSKYKKKKVQDPLIIAQWGHETHGKKHVKRPSGIAVTSDGIVIVTDQKAGTVSFWKPEAAFELPTIE